MPFIPGAFMAVAMISAQGPVRTGAYVIKVGGNVIGQDEYHFDGKVLASTIHDGSQGMLITTETSYDATLSPTHLTLTARTAIDAPVLQEVDVTFSSDSAQWTASARGQSQRGTTPLPSPYMVLQNLQFSHVAVALLRYDRAKGGVQRANAWFTRGAVVIPVEISLSGDSGSVLIASQLTNVRVDRTGWLTRAEVPSQNLVVEWQAKAGVVPAPQLPRTGTADTVAPAAVVETPYLFSSGALSIAGTLTMPKTVNGLVPVAIILAGSGPTDRNGNSRLGVGANTYAQIAWRLAERGIALLRYDKRGVGQSSKQFDMAQTGFDDFAADAAAGVRALKADTRFSRVVIVGHSEGASLAVRAANSGAPVAGVALLAGVGRPLDVVLREQLASQFDAAAMGAWDRAFAAYLRGEPVGDLPPGMQGLVAPVNRHFLQTGAAYHPAEELARVSQPVLIVQGERDIQVSVVDARALAAAKPSGTLLLIPDANHLFKSVASPDRSAQTTSYIDPTLPVVPALINALADWILRLR